jgi:iron complex transport system substrate-binding protein
MTRVRVRPTHYVAVLFTVFSILEGAVHAQQAPRRIVSLVPSATEALFAMGAGSRIVGVGSFDTFPPEVERLPRVGALLDPDVERILALKPDLMICYASQIDLQTQLSRAGIRLFPYKHGSLADVVTTIRQLGEAIAAPREAEALASRIERDLDGVRARVAGRGRPRVMLVIGRESQSLRTINVSGGYGFLHDLVELAGGANVFSDVKRESVNISSETVLARAPDVIVELRYSGTGTDGELERERRVWAALPGVPAVRTQRVHVLFGGELVIPGPRVVQTAALFAAVIHPPAAAAR